MKKLIHTIIVLSISILMFSCAKMEIVEINKDEKTRTVKFTKKNGKIKLVNQKLHLKSNTWFEAICNDEAVKQLKNCPDNKIDFSKVGKMLILQLENRERDSSKKKNKTSISEEQSSSSEEQSSSSQEEYSPAFLASEFLF
ncbi:hypothetical protein OAH45_00565 [Candidatus Pelagibacter sp.]|nr:hypothetical protein [Candidatus Pelagibacter sp.]MDC0465863.1 hypothetical protein [Candidatus Pelagibacter sp.]